MARLNISFFKLLPGNAKELRICATLEKYALLQLAR